MNGHLLRVAGPTAEALRDDPDALADLVMARSMSMFGNDGLDATSILDDALADLGGVGCLWRLIPGFLRKRMLGSVVPAGADATDALPNPAAAPYTPMTEEAIRAFVLEHEEDASPEDLDEMVRDAMADQAAIASGATPRGLPDTPDIDGVGEHLALRKDWHVLHMLLGGEPEEVTPGAGEAILGGDEIGEDLGYGPARLWSPPDVERIASALEALGVDGAMARFSRRQLVADDIYGAQGAGKAQIRSQLERLLRMYADAARAGDGMVGWIG